MLAGDTPLLNITSLGAGDTEWYMQGIPMLVSIWNCVQNNISVYGTLPHMEMYT